MNDGLIFIWGIGFGITLGMAIIFLMLLRQGFKEMAEKHKIENMSDEDFEAMKKAYWNKRING